MIIYFWTLKLKSYNYAIHPIRDIRKDVHAGRLFYEYSIFFSKDDYLIVFFNSSEQIVRIV